MTTEAGKRLLRKARSLNCTDEDIAAIEAEAYANGYEKRAVEDSFIRADALAEAAEQVRGLPWTHLIDRAAVLAILEELP